MRPQAPGLYDVLSLAAEAVEEMVVVPARDTHHAITDRVYGVLRRPTGGLSDLPGLAHRAISATVYAGVGGGLRAVNSGFGWAGRRGLGPRWETGTRSRFVTSAVNGLFGDRLVRERPALGVTMSPRVGGEDVELNPEALLAAYPEASPRIAVFVHGLSESEAYWRHRRAEVGSSYPETVAALGWTPVLLRANTGLSLRENGAHLAALLRDLVASWPVQVEQIALVGHSMGGLIIRAGCAVRMADDDTWAELVTDVVTLGSPHLGAPLARLIGESSTRSSRFPETAGLGVFLEHRSVGVRDLVEGLGEDVPALPHARYRLVSASLGRREGSPVDRVIGDLLVHRDSAQGRTRHTSLFPGAEVLHLDRAHHFHLLNDTRVHEALRRWLG